MSAITMFIEGERAVPNGLLSERAQELDIVVSRHLPMFYKRAFRFLGNMPDAEDAVQDALLSAYKHLGQFRGRAQLSTWLTTIVTNAALMKLRRRDSYLSLDEEQGEDGLTFSERLLDSKPSPEELCSAAEARDQLVEGVRQLSPKLRRTLQLRDIEGLTTKEAALVLGVPHGTVKAQLARARVKLAGIMNLTPARRRPARPCDFDWKDLSMKNRRSSAPNRQGPTGAPDRSRGPGRAHDQDRLRRVAGRWRHPLRIDHRRLRRAGRCHRVVQGARSGQR